MKRENNPGTTDLSIGVARQKKPYSKPEVLFFEELEAIAASCQTKAEVQGCNDPPNS